ncbi:serine/threonine-protein kinase [Deinococcus deserti]|uniref:Putative Serine/threonine protein kinase n=1 Tax=Deinococcus deserti (strain DSM 17065 / CIP 109153 / LMG 22923 / VCD115) TaxID=546414 RepID=C1CXK5_DEIDV|nr:serine/threonine-protein kinase [Deinococcus deserti]ACO44811.1 putative Serine/threonine protein kinase [Deinococcus deserti VCD115]
MTPERTIPGYSLLRPLGRGNTSLVYLAAAEDARYVALKIPHEHTLKEKEAAERFGNEVRLTLQFRHPHIVHAYAGTAFGTQAFLALKFYRQGDLTKQLADLPSGQRLPEPTALRILADVASALTYLHHLDAVHQDVKPQNVYVHDGRAALGDMGSAFFMSQGGKVSGSPFYMAPEIYHGESSSGASDVYSLGVMMYELLTGVRPFTGSSYEELMVAHLTRFPRSIAHLNSNVDRRVSRLAELALAKRPHERPSADELRRALLESLGELPQDEIYEECPDTPEVVAVGRKVGRHRPAPAAGPAPLPPPDPAAADKDIDRSSRWKLFRRRK